MTTTLDHTLKARLSAAIRLDQRACDYVPDDNPLAGHDLDDLRHEITVNAADQHPAVNMVAKTGEEGGLAHDLEGARFANRESAKQDRSAKRMRRARAMKAKHEDFDRIVNLPVQPSSEALAQAWQAVVHMLPIIERIATGKRRWAARFLGGLVDDVTQVVLEQMATALAKQDKFDLAVLVQAAEELGAQAERDGVPGDQMSEDERKERKTVAKARKWLMGMTNNRVRAVLADLYQSEENLRIENIELVGTVLANINGVGEDPMTANFKADRAAGFMGTQFRKPDGIDHTLLTAAVTAAITERGLDLLVEILLNPENRRSNGSVAWSQIAERVFLATPEADGNGAWLWDLVCKATAEHERVNMARGRAAMMHARNLFEWLPSMIASAVAAFDPHLIGWCPSRGRRAVMASDFELFYLGDEAEQRDLGAPALSYATVEDAVVALSETINLLTGDDLLSSVANA